MRSRKIPSRECSQRKHGLDSGPCLNELRGYVTFLKEQKLPKAHTRYALGREKYAKMLRYGEMIELSPEQFHDEMLRHGAPSIRLLRETMLKDRTTWDEMF